MALRRNSKILAVRALLAVVKSEEQRLLAAINSDQSSPEEISKAFNDLYTLWRTTVLKLADIEDASLTSVSSPSLSSQSAAQCNHGEIAVSLLIARLKTSMA